MEMILILTDVVIYWPDVLCWWLMGIALPIRYSRWQSDNSKLVLKPIDPYWPRAQYWWVRCCPRLDVYSVCVIYSIVTIIRRGVWRVTVIANPDRPTLLSVPWWYWYWCCARRGLVMMSASGHCYSCPLIVGDGDYLPPLLSLTATIPLLVPHVVYYLLYMTTTAHLSLLLPLCPCLVTCPAYTHHSCLSTHPYHLSPYPLKAEYPCAFVDLLGRWRWWWYLVCCCWTFEHCVVYCWWCVG